MALAVAIASGCAADPVLRPLTDPAAVAPCSTPGSSTELIARKGLLRARVQVQVSVVTGEAAVAASRGLAACPDADGRVPESACLVRVDSVTDAPFSAPRRAVAWLDPVRGLLQVESWEGRSHVLHRDCAGARYSSRWKMKGGHEVLTLTQVRERSEGTAHLPVVEGTSLPWLAAARGLDQADAVLEAAAWSKGELRPIRLAARESAVLERRALDGVAARRVDVAVRDATDSEGRDGVALFGMTSDVTLWLEIGSGRVLIIEGDAKKLGHVRAVNANAGIR